MDTKEMLQEIKKENRKVLFAVLLLFIILLIMFWFCCCGSETSLTLGDVADGDLTLVPEEPLVQAEDKPIEEDAEDPNEELPIETSPSP